jgi:type II secretory pathway component GspD/PulD (secretin)
MKVRNGDSIVNLSLREADVTQVLRMFADQAGMNIIFSSGVEGSVTMDLVDIPLAQALDLVIATNNLFYDIKGNTLVISTSDDRLSLSTSKEMTIVPVKYVNAAALAHFLNVNIYKKGKLNNTLSTNSPVTVNPATNELIITGTAQDVAIARKIVEQFDRKPTITTLKVNHTTPAEMASSICSTFIPSSMSVVNTEGSSGGAAGIPTGFASDEDSSSSSSSGSSGSSNGISVGGGQLACVLSAQNTFTDSSSSSEDDGDKSVSLPFMNLSVSYFPTLGTIQIIGGSDTQIDMIREYIAANDKKTPQAYLEVQIISLSESGSKSFDNTWQFLSKSFSFNAGGGNGFSTNAIHPVFFAGKGYYVPNTTDGFDSETGTYENSGYLTKWSTSPHLIYSINYLVENQKGRVLANPRVLLTSGQSSTIDLTSDYVSKVTSQYLDNGSSSGSSQVQKDYEVKDDNGIKVTITPFISPDGYVTLDIAPEYKTIAQQLYTTSDTGEQELAVTLLQRRDLSLKGVRIKDGETLVIGGMIQENESKTVSKIPFLGDIPVLGMFFRSTNTSKTKEEMVIMLTPQIVIDTEDAVADDVML